jgi:hypothetical protein
MMKGRHRELCGCCWFIALKIIVSIEFLMLLGLREVGLVERELNPRVRGY